jgi:hypothetical protein
MVIIPLESVPPMLPPPHRQQQQQQQQVVVYMGLLVMEIISGSEEVKDRHSYLLSEVNSSVPPSNSVEFDLMDVP